MPYFIYEDKKVYYRVVGHGAPMLLLHGNTASSRMFKGVVKEYAKKFTVIMLDFPGHGKSERLQKFETDFWFYNAEVSHALLNYLHLEKVFVVGTSGGALVAINLALEHPEVVSKVVADSFEGEMPLNSYLENLWKDRECDKKKFLAKLFWFYCHGFNWRSVVDMDTKMNLEFAKTGNSFFHKPFSSLQVPILLTGSREDEFCSFLDEIYADLQKKLPTAKVHLFAKGGHPAMLSNKKEFFEIVKNF